MVPKVLLTVNDFEHKQGGGRWPFSLFASSMHFANVVSCPAGAVWTAIYEIT